MKAGVTVQLESTQPSVKGLFETCHALILVQESPLAKFVILGRSTSL